MKINDKQRFLRLNIQRSNQKLILEALNYDKFTESQVARAIKDMCQGLTYLHTLGICHRDIKPGNVLYHVDSETWKLADFGISCVFDVNNPVIVGSIGTTHYMAPEMFSQSSYTQAVDMWALGVTTFYALSLQYPFDADDFDEVQELIMAEKFVFTSHFDDLGDAKNFIKSLLRPAADRLNAEDALTDYWLYYT